MKTEYQIARRLYFNEEGSRRRSATPAVRVAVLSIIIATVVMMLTLSVVLGFKQTVREKVASFSGHIQVVNFDNNNSYEMQPIVVSDSLLDAIRSIPGVAHVSVFATKPGILKTDDAFHGIVLRGSDRDTLTAPRIRLSRTLSRQLRLAEDSSTYCYFIGDEVRARRYRLAAPYDTQFADYDNLFVFCPLSEVQRLNGWRSDQASGLAIYIDDFDRLDELTDAIYFRTANHPDADGNYLYTQAVTSLNPALFAWLDLLDMNVVIILLLMLAVSAMGIISGLIILILDSVRMIGILKALGAANRFIRRIFLYEAGMLILRGIVIGNIVGLLLFAVQHLGQVIPLDPATYYVSFVPTAFCWQAWLLLDVGTLLLTLLLLILPSAIVSRISPAEVMHFE